jgi:lipid II:glycine glycyltransferase (peptidoglycan interpeptide bridge formation enzyme)
MRTRLLSLADRAAWRTTLERFSSDTYFGPEYHAACEDQEGSAAAFVAEDGGETLFYPFFRRPIRAVCSAPVDDGLSDIETAYGYSGPLATTTDQAFLARAWRAFADLCREQRVVAEFIRFHPYLENHRFLAGFAPVHFDRFTVAVPLSRSPDALWNGYPPEQRNRLRKAMRRGLTATSEPVAESLGEFRRLYRATMDRVGARADYYFSDAYFARLANQLGDGIALWAVRDHDRMVAAALFLVDRTSGRMHYHLGGSDAAALAHAPNNWLFHCAALDGGSQGLRSLHLGGGRSPDADDPLFRFKQTFSGQRLPFYIGKRIHDPDAYEMLCTTWQTRSGAVDRPPFLLMYRLEQWAKPPASNS